ncbi:hypothetical protein J2810_004630 [Chryseobacterium rhizosphaerae]|nr:hypothetical protein [Chryseobacterium rhizosphaerae]MDR6548540.1 hypothetical protein [Chryseobacterium rhizosphaerae]
MKYPKPKLFKPTEKEFSEAGKKVAKQLSESLQIRTPKGNTIRGKRKSK